jgi:hypothetical protein
MDSKRHLVDYCSPKDRRRIKRCDILYLDAVRRDSVEKIDTKEEYKLTEIDLGEGETSFKGLVDPLEISFTPVISSP